MNKHRLLVGFAILSSLILGATACSAPDGGDGKPMDVTILGNWFAQAEMGGYYQAEAEDLVNGDIATFKNKQGGPGIQTIPQVAAGEAEFGIGNADEILVAASNGLPIVAVAAGPQTNLQALAYHKGSGIKDFSDLNGRTVSRVPSPYWDYIKKNYELDAVHEINIGSLSSFQEDENMVLQTFITAEPYTIKEMGMDDVDYLRVADSGYNAYQNVMFTTKDMVDQHPDVVEAVVDGTRQGWKDLVDNPEPAKDLIMKTNTDGDPKMYDFAIKMYEDEPDLLGTEDQIGTFSNERWSELKNQLDEIGQLDDDFDVTDAYTTEFSNK